MSDCNSSHYIKDVTEYYLNVGHDFLVLILIEFDRTFTNNFHIGLCPQRRLKTLPIKIVKTFYIHVFRAFSFTTKCPVLL